MLNRKLSLLLAAIMLAVTVLALPTPTAHAQNLGSLTCPYTDGAYYQPFVLMRYSHNNHRVTLVDYSTGQEVRQLAADMPSSAVWLWNWSPDCRYIAAHRDHTDNTPNTLYLWDAITGEQVNALSAPTLNSSNRNHDVSWSPDGSHALIETRHGTFLWDAATRANTLLTHTEGIAPDFEDIAWDYAANRVIISGSPAVIAYDLTTGAQTALYHTAADHPDHARFVITPDHSTLVVYTEHAYTGEYTGYITAYDMTIGTARELDANGFAANFAEQAAISPDGRYFAIGMTHLRVWDLASDNPQPAFLHNLHRFIAPHELTFRDGTTVRGRLFSRYFDIDIVTGSILTF
jgi:hypothetical protein